MMNDERNPMGQADAPVQFIIHHSSFIIR